MKKRFRVITTGAGLEDSLNRLYMEGYTFLTATDTAVIMECVHVTDTDMRRQSDFEEVMRSRRG